MKKGSLATNLRYLERASYAVIVPSVFGFIGYRFYQHQKYEAEKKLVELRKIEDKYIDQAQKNLIKAREKCKEPQLKINRSVYSEDINFVKL